MLSQEQKQKMILNNSVFEKTMDNVRKHRYIKLVTANKTRNQIVSEPNYHATKLSCENLFTIEMKKVKVKMNKPIYLGLRVLEICKIRTYEFQCDYIKTKHQNNSDLCYLDKYSFII